MRQEISLLGAKEIREIATSLDLVPSKGLGQNFVHDANTCEKIVRLAALKDSDPVVEIGPGLGSLTLALLRAGAAVTAVEIDKRLASRLPQTLREHGATDESFEVITKDAMQLRSEEIAECSLLVANLPYNVSVPVILHILSMARISRAVVMVQSEVATRLAAQPGSKEYGVPSAKVAWFADAAIADRVSAKVFWPVPRVDSSLLTLRVHPPLSSEADRELTFKVIDTAFNQRRKMLRSSLESLISQYLPNQSSEEVLESSGIKPTERAESIQIEGFLAIAKTLQKR
ncbi:MAG: 16S rRNA (adenine(1518)-N(6)/adenine(1519)-N(6))-dimethyltransferase RsmA [Candidatus Nanopelagicaceae bacterium]